jgi:hypothetical protein
MRDAGRGICIKVYRVTVGERGLFRLFDMLKSVELPFNDEKEMMTDIPRKSRRCQDCLSTEWMNNSQ